MRLFGHYGWSIIHRDLCRLCFYRIAVTFFWEPIMLAGRRSLLASSSNTFTWRNNGPKSVKFVDCSRELKFSLKFAFVWSGQSRQIYVQKLLWGSGIFGYGFVSSNSHLRNIWIGATLLLFMCCLQIEVQSRAFPFMKIISKFSVIYSSLALFSKTIRNDFNREFDFFSFGKIAGCFKEWIFITNEEN